VDDRSAIEALLLAEGDDGLLQLLAQLVVTFGLRPVHCGADRRDQAAVRREQRRGYDERIGDCGP